MLGSLSLDLGLGLDLGLDLDLDLELVLELGLELGLECEEDLRPRLASRRRRLHLGSHHLHRPSASPSRYRQRSDYRRHGADLDVALVLHRRLGDPRRL